MLLPLFLSSDFKIKCAKGVNNNNSCFLLFSHIFFLSSFLVCVNVCRGQRILPFLVLLATREKEEKKTSEDSLLLLLLLPKKVRGRKVGGGGVLVDPARLCTRGGEGGRRNKEEEEEEEEVEQRKRKIEKEKNCPCSTRRRKEDHLCEYRGGGGLKYLPSFFGKKTPCVVYILEQRKARN